MRFSGAIGVNGGSATRSKTRSEGRKLSRSGLPLAPLFQSRSDHPNRKHARDTHDYHFVQLHRQTERRQVTEWWTNSRAGGWVEVRTEACTFDSSPPCTPLRFQLSQLRLDVQACTPLPAAGINSQIKCFSGAYCLEQGSVPFCFLLLFLPPFSLATVFSSADTGWVFKKRIS
jgi:hypothetical protein